METTVHLTSHSTFITLGIFSIFSHSHSAALQVQRNFLFPYLSNHIYFNAAMLIRIILLHAKLSLSRSVYCPISYNKSQFSAAHFGIFNMQGCRTKLADTIQPHQAPSASGRVCGRVEAGQTTDHHICVHPLHDPFHLLCAHTIIESRTLGA